MNDINSTSIHEKQLSSWYAMALDLVVDLAAVLPRTTDDDSQVAVILKQFAMRKGNKLTPRQLEAVIALMKTATLEAAAQLLCLSANTMRRHIETVLENTGLPLRGAAELRGWCLGVKDSQAHSEIWTLSTKQNGRNR